MSDIPAGGPSPWPPRPVATTPPAPQAPETGTAAREAERQPSEHEHEHEPSGPEPLGVVRTATGDAEVDARLERLADTDLLTTDGHLEVYEDVHRGLRDALTALDAQPGPRPPAPAPPTHPHHRTRS